MEHMSSPSCVFLCFFLEFFLFRNIWRLCCHCSAYRSPNLKGDHAFFFLTVIFTREICWKQFNHGLRESMTQTCFELEISSFSWNGHRTDSGFKFRAWIFFKHRFIFKALFLPGFQQSKFQVFRCSFRKVQQLQQILLSLEFGVLKGGGIWVGLNGVFQDSKYLPTW